MLFRISCSEGNAIVEAASAAEAEKTLRSYLNTRSFYPVKNLTVEPYHPADGIVWSNLLPPR